MSQSAKAGDEVEVLYEGSLEDGTVFDKTEGGEGFRFVVGSPEVIEGVSQGVMGMEVGHKKEISVPPEKGYGDYQDQLVITVPRDRIPGDAEEGTPLTDGTENGMVWYVKQITEEHGVLDGNHPLAGKTLRFQIELKQIV